MQRMPADGVASGGKIKPAAAGVDDRHVHALIVWLQDYLLLSDCSNLTRL
ncbi:hypothetical protein [Cobetia sp. AM6]|nr:hypothetical protein [Cobetia sp. AM6]